MTTRKTLSDRGVSALKPRAARYAFPDPELVGHYVRVMPSGAKSFAAISRAPAGKQVWTTIGPTDRLPITEARSRARAIIERVQAGKPAIEPKAETFGAVTANWLQRHVAANGLVSERQIGGCWTRMSCRAGATASWWRSAAPTSPPCSIRSKTGTASGKPTSA